MGDDGPREVVGPTGESDVQWVACKEGSLQALARTEVKREVAVPLAKEAPAPGSLLFADGYGGEFVVRGRVAPVSIQTHARFLNEAKIRTTSCPGALDNLVRASP